MASPSRRRKYLIARVPGTDREFETLLRRASAMLKTRQPGNLKAVGLSRKSVIPAA